MKKEKHILTSAAVILTVCLFSVAAFGASTETVGALVCKYTCDEAPSFSVNETDDSLSCDVTIKGGKAATINFKTSKGVKGLSKPYAININCGADTLKKLTVDMGKGTTGTVSVTAKNISVIKTKTCDLKVFSEGTKIKTIKADPGLSEAKAPDAKVGYIQVTKYVGDFDKADTSYKEPAPESCVVFRSIKKIKTLKFNKYKQHWVSQVKAENIGTIRASSISHLYVDQKIRALRTYNLTGHIRVGCREESPDSGSSATNVYLKSKIRKIFCANMYDCQIRAGVPDLHDSEDPYNNYGVIKAQGVIRKFRVAAMVNSIVVSGKKMKIPGKRHRPYYGNNCEIWENCKLRKLTLKQGGN
ncbi:hypothetical protein IKZ80_07665 [bacterium]|nr:hypothetical protein [bacterium]